MYPVIAVLDNCTISHKRNDFSNDRDLVENCFPYKMWDFDEIPFASQCYTVVYYKAMLRPELYIKTTSRIGIDCLMTLRPRGHKTFFRLNSTEYEINHAHKC